MKNYDEDYLELPTTIYLPEDTEINSELIEKLLEYHKADLPRYKILGDYYKGRARIQDREKNEDKANNKLALDYAGYIVDILLGMFVGKPISYNASKENEDIMSAIQDVFDANDEQDENTEIAKIAGIKGKAYEIVYLDEYGDINFNEIEPDNMMMVYTDSIKPEPLFALYIREQLTVDTLGTEGDRPLNITVYSDTEIIEYAQIDKEFKEIDRRLHTFREVPVIEFLNNDEKIGDFEKVLSLIDAINKAQSDTANDFEEFTDAFLVLYGMLNADSNDLEQMKKDKIILLDKTNGALQGAEWLIKNINDTALENYKNRLDNDIHKFAKVPNMSDEHFAGNVSGESMKYKLFATDQIISQKQRKFKTGLQKRIRLILAVESIKKNADFDYRDIGIVFNDNKPYNELDNINTVKAALDAGLSKQYSYSKLRDLDDVLEELDRQEEETNAYADAFSRALIKDGEADEE